MIIPFVYSLITAGATVAGGMLPLTKALKRVDSRYLIAFASGIMVSVALFDLIPESQGAGVWFLPLGFFSIYLIEKFLAIHACHEHEVTHREIHHHIGWVSLIGIAAESLIDGIAIGVGYRASPTLGLLIALAVFAHEIPRGFTTTVIMQHAGYTKNVTLGALAIDALFTPLGVAVSAFFTASAFTSLIAFAAGVFLYVGAADLLPEAHQRFNWKVVASVILGVLLIPFFGIMF